MRQIFRYLFTFLALGMIFLSSCGKVNHYKFSDAEVNFLPYKLGDTIYVINNLDTIDMEVVKFTMKELEDSYQSRQTYQTLTINATNESFNYHVSQYQTNKYNKFTVDLLLFFKNDDNSFHYTNEPASYVEFYDSMLIQNRMYYDILGITDTTNLSVLYLHSNKGFLLMKTNQSEYYFY